MKRKLRILLLGFIVLSLAGLIGIVLVNFVITPGHKSLPFKIQDSGVTIEKIRYTGYSAEDQGRREWELEADSATLLEKGDLTVFTDVKVVFFSKDGKTYTLMGREGNYNKRSGLISVAGEVTLVTEGSEGDTYRLETESLEYSTQSKMLTSAEHVEISSRAMRVTGVGLKIDVKEGRLSVLKDVRTVINDDVI
jgi:LPS export ABC transporter protein LptC